MKTPFRWFAMAIATAMFGQAALFQFAPVVAIAASATYQNPVAGQNVSVITTYESEIARAKNVYLSANTLAGTGKYIGKTADQVRAGAHAYANMLRGLIAQISPSANPPLATVASYVANSQSTIQAVATPTSANDVISLMDLPPDLQLTSGTVKISGDANCVSKTNAALNLLKSKAMNDYNRIAKYVGVIACVDQGSGMWAWESPPRYTVGKVTFDADTMWYAGTIAHDSCHSVQYNTYKAAHPGQSVPASIYSGETAESQCLDVQYRALQRMGASSTTLAYMKTLLTTKYWTGDYANRWW